MIDNRDFKDKFNNIIAIEDDDESIALSLLKLGYSIHKLLPDPSFNEYCDGTWGIRIKRRIFQHAGMMENHIVIVNVFKLDPENGERLLWYTDLGNQQEEGE